MEAAEAQRYANESVLPDVQASSHALDASECRALGVELDAALGLADYCRFIAQEQVSSRADEFVSLALRLYEETLSVGHVAHTAAGLREHARLQRDPRHLSERHA